MKSLGIAHRFRDLRKDLGYTQTEFGDIFGLSQDAISAIETGKNKPTLDVLKRLNDEFNISIEWVILGNEPMYNQTPLPIDHDTAIRLIKDIPQEINDSESVLYIPIEHQIENDNSAIRYLAVSKIFTRPHHIENIKAFKMESNSMVPTIATGDYVIYVSGHIPQYEGIYMVELDKRFQVRRVIFKDNGDAVFKPDNPDYQEETITAEQIKQGAILGKVILYIGRP